MKITATDRLMKSLSSARILCDKSDVKQLSPEQVAALHAFKHEVLAALFHLFEKVPEDTAKTIVSKHLAEAMQEGTT
jgi:hypothetical protein